MSSSIPEIFADFDSGKISRRQLLAALGAAAIAIPGISLAQGTTGAADSTGRGGRGGRGRGGAAAPRDTTPLVMPFEPTGWKPVWMDHFNYQCVDHKKAAAFYCTLMGWKIRSINDKEALLDMGEVGGMRLRPGLTVPPPPAITDAGLGVQRPQINAVWDGFAWGLAEWDEKAIKAALTKRGLNPVAKNDGDYKSFWFKDPDGFDVAVTNGTREIRRKKAIDNKLQMKPPFEPTNWHTLYLDHISFEVPDYRRSAAFYQALLGWAPLNAGGGGGGGGQTSIVIGEGGSVGGAIIRGNAAARAATAAARGDSSGRAGGAGTAAAAPVAQGRANGVTAAIGHISFGIENWDTERVRGELKARDVCYTNRQTGAREPREDFTGTLLSFHVPDAQGWDLQIGNKIKAGR